MPKNLIFTDKEIVFLKELVKQKVDFMIVGLAAATLQGAPVVTQDIDLWFRNLSDPKIGKVLRKIGGAYVPPFGTNSPMFVGDNVELYDIVFNMDGLGPYAQEVKKSMQVPLGRFKVKILPLERIIKSKEVADREKDRLVLPILRQVLKTIKSVK